MIIMSQWLVKHPSVRQRVKNGWQLSEEFSLRYTPQIGIRTQVIGKSIKDDKFRQGAENKEYMCSPEECQTRRDG